jgi:putative oxidoreductase
MDQLAARFDAPLALLARILMAVLFVMAGLDAVMKMEAFTARLVADGLPSWSFTPVFWFLIITALFLMLGFKTRWVGLLMAGFSFTSGMIDYADFQQPTDMVMLLKNIALTGGYLFVALHGAGRWSIDAAMERYKASHPG